MEINATEGDFANWIREILHISLKEKDEQFLYDIGDNDLFEAIVDKSLFTQYIEQLRGINCSEEMILVSSKSYEILLTEEPSENPIKNTIIEDQDNSVKYFLSRPSNEYLLFLIYKLSPTFSPLFLQLMEGMRISYSFDTGEEIDIFKLLRKRCSFRTLRIESERNRTVTEFEKFSSAYLFQLSYNLNIAFVPQLYLDEFLRTERISRIRHSDFRDIEPPRRHYIPDLIYHYQLAVAADNPFLEFLSYYHVIEHFFEEVFEKDLVERVRNKITHPEFSYKREKDITGLIKDISRSFKIRDEKGDEKVIFNEQEALRLTLTLYVDIVKLQEKLASYDDNLINYYQSTKVPFSDASEVDLQESDTSKIFKKLAARIYKTRNSIVHSKKSDKARYTPFKDDRILVKEIPLLRFISEQIIINTSKLIE